MVDITIIRNSKTVLARPSMVGYCRGRNLHKELIRAKVTKKRKSNRIKKLERKDAKIAGSVQQPHIIGVQELVENGKSQAP